MISFSIIKFFIQYQQFAYSITLNFCEVIMSNQEYFIYNFSNFCNKINLKLFLYYNSLYNIRIKKHVKIETFIKIK